MVAKLCRNVLDRLNIRYHSCALLDPSYMAASKCSSETPTLELQATTLASD